MADLNNLLQDINDANDADDIDGTERDLEVENEEKENYIDTGDVEQEGGFLRSDEKATQDDNFDGSEGGDENDFSESQHDGGRRENDEGDNEDIEYTQLKRLWVTEMSCPELFPYDSDTFEMHKNLLEGQEELIAQLSNAAATSQSSNENELNPVSARNKKGNNQLDPQLTALAASIYRMEADRVRFLLADLARLRLSKIESHPLYMRTMVNRMSENEVKYLVSYGELLEKHLRRTVLNHMPRDSLKKLDEPEMIDSPDLNQYVFCQIIENVVIAEDSFGNDEDDENDDGLGPQEYEAGASLIARYGLVKDLVLEGKILLLL